MTRLLLLLALAFPSSATDVPSWILPRILYTESRSTYRDDGSIRYVDMRRGPSGERGCFQITKRAFRQVARRGEEYWRVEIDTAFCEEIATRYLIYCYRRTGSWDRAIESYNAGPGNRSPAYLNKVRSAR